MNSFNQELVVIAVIGGLSALISDLICKYTFINRKYGPILTAIIIFIVMIILQNANYI